MSLTADVLQFDPLPAVRLDVAVGQSTSWRVTGSGGDLEWLAGEGRGPAVFADPWAPLGIPVTYRLTAESGGPWEAGPVLRFFTGQHAITDLTGRKVVDFRWTPGDPWEQEPRATFAETWGSPYPVPALAPAAGAGGGTVTAKTTGTSTKTMVQLVAVNRPLLLLHNAVVCAMPDCDVPLVRTILLGSAPADRTGRTDVAERRWVLTYRLVRRPFGYLAPVVTIADVLHEWDTTADMLTDVATGAELVRGDWRVHG